MTRVKIEIDLDEEVFKSYQLEAARREVPLERLVEQTVRALLAEYDLEHEEGTDHPIIPG